ncbi:O-antigen ligase family protein [Chroococcidiopsis thermalis]|uniref:O-antigen polymerase n=1 Tax=Chroococcidiopsis thermalis (strain PCC 7203) TaxID=251229 RepID=K9TYJ9_CHRTP|nr:O-antigen ligase family protein [Chroococcidiopsis thermalis]AFY87655.1 O-antigen polymerase [Chroococcidiopsis thermalis PCC 7203]PSB49836.1 O-antigen ligase family protein [Cyanosarcina cf. burmensis CCALA 770]
MKLQIAIQKNLFEKGFVVLALLLFSDALISLFRRQEGFVLDATEGDPVMQIFLFGVYAVTFFLILLRWKSVMQLVLKEKLLILLVAIALFSVLWSVAPIVTLRRSVALVMTTLFGVYLATRYSLKQQLQLLAWTLGIAIVLSFLFAIALPAYGVHQEGGHIGAWRGIFVHKNALGRAMGLSVVLFSLFALYSYRYRWIAWTGFALSVALILLSTSATPFLSSLIVLALLPLYSLWRWRNPLFMHCVVMTVTLGAAMVLWLLSQVEAILAATGRDLTFTGRTELWSVLLQAIQKYPWLGYGYSAFWLGWQGESGRVWNVLIWEPTYAHNGYLQLGLDLGLLGIAVFVLGFSIYFGRSLIWARTNQTATGMFPLAFLTFLLPYNMTDSIILQQNNIFWIFYVSTVFSMTIQPQPAKPPATRKFSA